MRVALVTGARGGIGAALVERLAAYGWAVHGVDVDDADLTDLVAVVLGPSGSGFTGVALPLDLGWTAA